jgi:hypothetical protein
MAKGYRCDPYCQTLRERSSNPSLPDRLPGIRVRTTGSHQQYGHPQVDRILSVQPRGKDAKPYQAEQFLDMIEEFGLKIEP